MSARTLRALWRNRHRVDARFRRDPAQPRALHRSCCAQPRGVTHELRRMNLYGILGQRRARRSAAIVGQMQHDLFHVYTVDEHILMVIRNLRRFTESQHAHEYPLCSRLIGDFEPQGSALPRRTVPRHRQGPRRRPFDARRASTRGASAARTALPREDAELVALAGRAAPVDVVDGAEAGPVRSRRRSRRSPTRVGTERRLDRALSADGRRHPRHEPARCGTRGRRSCSRTCFTRRARGSPEPRAASTLADSLLARAARGAAAAAALRRAGRRRARAVGAARHRLLPAAHRGRDRVARAPPALARRRAPAPVVQRAAVARRSRAAGARSTCPTRRICSRGSAASSGAGDCRSSKRRSTRPRHGYALDTFTVHDPGGPDGVVSRRDPARRIRARAGAEGAAAARAARSSAARAGTCGTSR